MATPSSSQVIPFPLPSYLATYFANRITTETIILQDGTYAKPFHVKRNSAFGKFICRCFTKSEKPIFIEKGFTFFIKVEDHKTTQEKLTVNSRYSFLELSESTVNDIIEIFKELFEDNLKNYVSGAEDFGYGLTNKFSSCISLEFVTVISVILIGIFSNLQAIMTQL